MERFVFHSHQNKSTDFLTYLFPLSYKIRSLRTPSIKNHEENVFLANHRTNNSSTASLDVFQEFQTFTKDYD